MALLLIDRFAAPRLPSRFYASARDGRFGRFTRLNPLRPNSQFDPPFRELADAAQCQRGERRSVVSADHLGQSGLPKDPLKPGFYFLLPGSLQRAAQKQIPRKVIADGQRITALTVTQKKVALKVCTPDLIGRLPLSKRFAIRSHSATPYAGLDQTRTLQDLAPSRIRRPLKFRPFMAQLVQDLFRAPLLAPHFGLHNSALAFLPRSDWDDGAARARVPQVLAVPLLITPDPLIGRRSATP